MPDSKQPPQYPVRKGDVVVTVHLHNYSHLTDGSYGHRTWHVAIVARATRAGWATKVIEGPDHSPITWWNTIYTLSPEAKVAARPLWGQEWRSEEACVAAIKGAMGPLNA